MTGPGTRYLRRAVDPASRLRLFCFHHAGGAASTFASWQKAFGPDVAVLPVQLPGREERTREPSISDLDTLVAELDEGLGPWLNMPFAFYGHSMGALIAYRLAERRAGRGSSGPVRLLVGGYPAPDSAPPLELIERLSDAELTRWMVAIGGTSAELLRYPEWLAPAIRLLRADLRLCGSQGSAPGRRPTGPGRTLLTCPIDAFTGSEDPLVTAEGASGWARHTLAECRVHTVPGDHFFLHNPAVTFKHLLASLLAPGRLTTHTDQA